MDFLGISLPSYSLETVFGSAISGIFLGAIYALVALGLTLIYGVLHIINFAHGTLLMLAMYAVFFLWSVFGVDPYVAMLIVVPGGYLFGYALQRSVIGRTSHGRDEIILLTTLGVSAKERQGARLMGINVEHIFAVSFGIGTACVAAAASLLAPTYAVFPQVGYLFVLIAFTVVVLGGMGSFVGALVGGLVIGITEQIGRLYLGESLGLITISAIFILILLFRPTGLFGQRL